METKAYLFKNITSLTMPVPGIISKMVAIGDSGQNILDAIKNWPGDISNSFELKHNIPESVIEFETDIFQQESSKLIKEFTERQDSLEAFRKEFENLSKRPVEDPFVPVALRDASRIKNSVALLLTVLWNDKISGLVNEIPEEKYPVLEVRIGKLLSNEAIALCSSLISLDEASTHKLACRELANELRKREIFDGFYSDVVSHPTALFQKLRINDAVLYKEQTMYLTMDMLDSLMDFTIEARKYWNKIAEKKLYNELDIAALKEWGIIKSPGIIGALGLVAEEAEDEDPISKMENAYNELYNIKDEILKSIKITREIGYVGFDIWLSDGWPPAAGVSPEDRSLWVAQCAIEDLALPIEEANSYGHIFPILLGFIIKYINTPDNAIFRGVSTPVHPIPEHLFATYAVETLASAIMPHAVSDYISDRTEFKIKSIYGGISIKLLQAYDPVDIDEHEWSRKNNIFDLPQSLQIYNDLLNKPSVFEDQVNKLRRWRDELEQNNYRTSLAGSDLVIDDYYHFNRSRAYLEKNRSSFDLISSKIEKIRINLSNVEVINNIRRVFDSMRDKLNSDYLNLGYVKIPFDTRVISVLASAGEFVNEGKPVATAIDRFRCNAKAFIVHDELSESKLVPMSVWKIELNGKSEVGTNVFFSCIIKKLEPIQGGSWQIEMEIFASINIVVEGISNLQPVLPLSSRFLSPVVSGITEDLLNEVEEMIPNYGVADVKFVEQIF